MTLFDRQKDKFLKTNRILLIKRQEVGLSNKTSIELWIRVIKYHNLIRVESSQGIDLFFDYTNELDKAISEAIRIYKEG